MINDLTILSVDGIDPELTYKALRLSTINFNAKSVKLLSFRKPVNTEGIEFILIPKLTQSGYNEFIAKELYKYIETSHVLIIQTDGFLLNANRWTNDFLQYDYIGAPWPAWLLDELYKTKGLPLKNKCHIGNGGFSLRSRRILELSATIPYSGGNEDNHFCFDAPIGRREFFISNGMIYASVDIAEIFSIEIPLVSTREDNLKKDADYSYYFGFHGTGHKIPLQQLVNFKGELSV